MTEIEAMQRFTALYDAHQRQVHGYAVSRAGRQGADEIVSDTFLVAWRRFGEIPQPALPWLLGVARNLIREQTRQSARQESIEAELRAWTAHEPAQGTDPAELVADRDAVLGALARLGPDDRELLTLVAWHGLNARQAAGVIGCSTATYFVRLHRARRRLEQAVDDLDHNPRPAARPAERPAGLSPITLPPAGPPTRPLTDLTRTTRKDSTR